MKKNKMFKDESEIIRTQELKSEHGLTGIKGRLGRKEGEMICMEARKNVDWVVLKG